MNSVMTGEDPYPNGRDHYWWLHPVFRGEQTLDLGNSQVMPEECLLWVESTAPAPNIEHALPADGGPFGQFAAILFKLNNYRPGPVEGWYVVLCVEAETRWAVGQLRADSHYPVQVFEDYVFDSEAAARDAAAQLRAEFGGPARPE